MSLYIENTVINFQTHKQQKVLHRLFQAETLRAARPVPVSRQQPLPLLDGIIRRTMELTETLIVGRAFTL